MNKRLAQLIEKHGVHQGNAFTDLQVSSFIRPFGHTETNGFTCPEGELRRKDLDGFCRHHPFAVPMTERYKDTQCVLYVWRTPWTTYGATLTDAKGKILCRKTVDNLSVRAKANAADAIAILEAAARLHEEGEANDEGLVAELTSDLRRAYRANVKLFGERTAKGIRHASASKIARIAALIEKAKDAERFIGGFEGDELQEGIDELLGGLRSAIDDVEPKVASRPNNGQSTSATPLR